MNLSAIAQQFAVYGRPGAVEPTGNGNINDTYLATAESASACHRFILQRLNHRVFTSPATVMQNLRLVTEHVQVRLSFEPRTAGRVWDLPHIIRTRDGRDFFEDGDGNYWRALTLVDAATAFDSLRDLRHAFEAGSVLGLFHRLTDDLPTPALGDPLPGFHVTPGYFDRLDAALDTPAGRARASASPEAAGCLHRVERLREWCGTLERARARGELAVRTIHGDPKAANIMMDDDTGRAVSLIDLDTVKAGLIHYDVGDCMRSCCNPAGEDAQLDDVRFDLDLCAAITRGYVGRAGASLTEADRHYLFDCIRLLTFELGLRFFADHVAGDVYFKTRYPGHNLHRARVQFALQDSIEAQEPEIRRILNGGA